MISLETVKFTKAEVATKVCRHIGIGDPEISTGSTVNSEVLTRIAQKFSLDISGCTTSYCKFETILNFFGEYYDPNLDSSEHSPTGGGTISAHGWRKLARACGALNFCFILNISEASVSEKYQDEFGKSYGFTDSVTGRVPLLEADAGSKVLFYNTSNSKLKPTKSFLAHAQIAEIDRQLDGSYKISFANFNYFPSPISREDVHVEGWNNQHAIAEIASEGFNSMISLGGSAGTRDIKVTSAANVASAISVDDISNRGTEFDVDVRPDTGSLRLYRGMVFTPHYALGEFIDNSITSAMRNKPELEARFGADYKLQIAVSFDSASNSLEVSDNAAGIKRDDIGLALKAGATSNDNQIGLSKYGIGMKAAAFWFGSTLELETHPLGESSGWKVTLDIAGDEALPAHVSVKPIPHRGSPGTVLRVKNLWSGVPKTRASNAVKRYLPSIYRSFIQTDDLDADQVPTELSFEGQTLSYEAPELLRAPFWPNQDGPAAGSVEKTWRQAVVIVLESGIEIRGWVGILKTMNRDASGLTLFYNKKAIAGAVPTGDLSADDERTSDRSYRPRGLFKQSGSKTDQTFVGEFDVSALGKTITTNDVRWTAEQREEFEKLLVQALQAGSPDFGEGETLIRMASNVMRRQSARSAKTVEEILESDRHLEKIAQSRLDGNLNHGPDGIVKPLLSPFSSDDLEGAAISIELTDDEGHNHAFKLALGQSRNSDFLSLRNLNSSTHEIDVNMAHPILDSVDAGDKDIRRVIQIMCLALGVAEVFAETDEGLALRRKFNNSLDLLGSLREET